ncbi:hypothetical protein FRC02_002436 [Tulasnella sp. 418]|nr:hypothetical protein FRC02_002436 [Tulasnella sp. 418]
MCRQIQDRDFGRYLSLWRKSRVQPGHSVSSETFTRDLSYLRTVLRLLLRDQERWARELDEHGHLTHIEAIRSNDSLPLDTQLLAFILLAYIAGRNGDQNAPPSQYYSQARVDRVVERLRSTDHRKIKDIIGNFQPNYVDPINQSISAYIKTAQQYGRIPNSEFDEVSLRAKSMMDHIRDAAAPRH